MELLIALIAELIAAIFVPFIVLIIEAIFSFIAFVSYHLFGHVIEARLSFGDKYNFDNPLIGKGLMIVSGVFGVLFVLGLVFVFVLNTFFFTSTIRWVGNEAYQQTGIAIDFDDVEGSFFGGTFDFSNLNIERRGDYPTEYDLTVKTAAVDINITSLLFGIASLSSLEVEGVEGDAWTKGISETAPESASENQEITSDEAKPRRAFRVDKVDITNVNLTLHKEGVAPLSLDVESIDSAPFRSEYAVFDIFFRSNIQGRVNSSEIRIATQGNGTGRRTQWTIEDFPAELVRHYVERAPFHWFTGGTIDVEVRDEWDDDGNAEIDMDWRLALKAVRVVTPENVGFVNRAIAGPIANYINGREDDIDLRFALVMNEEQFKTKSSLSAAGLWDAVVDGTAKAIAEKSKSTTEEVKEGINDAVDFFEGYLNEQRKDDE